MNKDTLIKYALYAAGAYLVYKYVWPMVSGMLNPAPAQTTVTTTPAPALVPNASTNPAAGTVLTNPFAGQPITNASNTTTITGQPPAPAPAQQPLANPTHDPNQHTPRGRLLLAAGYPQGGLTADAWNYYYAQITGVPQTTDLFGADRNELISVDVYLSRRSDAGLDIDAWPSTWGTDTTGGLAGLSPWLV